MANTPGGLAAVMAPGPRRSGRGGLQLRMPQSAASGRSWLIFIIADRAPGQPGVPYPHRRHKPARLAQRAVAGTRRGARVHVRRSGIRADACGCNTDCNWPVLLCQIENREHTRGRPRIPLGGFVGLIGGVV